MPEMIHEPLPPTAIAYQKTQVNGAAARKLAIKRESAVEQARTVGYDYYSILNFNPTWLTVESGVIDIKVPPANHKTLGIKKRIKFGAEERVGSLFVITKLEGYSRITSATVSGDPNLPETEYDWRVVLPCEQAWSFERGYNDPTNPNSIGGVLIFKGDGHKLNQQVKEGVISIPTATRLKNGSFAFTSKEVSLVDKLTETLARQKAYCMNKIVQAKEWAASENPLIRGSVDKNHSTWAQFAVDMGWQDAGRMPFLTPNDRDEGCKKCGLMRTNGAALFCTCGHPYDAFEAFMAGMEVDRNILATLPEEQLAEVKKEMKRRAELFA